MSEKKKKLIERFNTFFTFSLTSPIKNFIQRHEIFVSPVNKHVAKPGEE